jgi:hypothetical protein
MNTIREFLDGKKTYIIAAIYGLDAVGAQLGWWNADSIRSIMEQVFMVFALRRSI